MSSSTGATTILTDRIFTPGLAQVAYLIADEAIGEVAIIDPRRDVDEYLRWAEERGLRYVAILETHVHADFVSGSLELSAATGAPIYASRLGDVGFRHIPIDDDDVVNVGSIRLRAVWTPGHTPEHMAFLLLPDPQRETPTALYSGDVLFVGDVGRPDLLGEKATARLSEQLFETVTERLKTLPDDLIVYPAHTAGSSCGKNIGDAPSTTIGAEKAGNYAFQPKDRDEFIDVVMTGMPVPPAYYPQLKKINKQGAAPLGDLPSPKAMSAGDIRAAMDAGALVIDTRDFSLFGRAHIPGSLFAGWGANFHTWMGWIAPYDRDLVIVGDASQVDGVVTALRQIGLDRVIGDLDGGFDAWDGDTETLPQLDVGTLSGNLDAYQVLDVRSRDEWQAGHIDGAAHLPANEIVRGATPDVPPPGKLLAVICGSGYRSTVAASILMARGITNVVNVPGGMSAWRDAGLPAIR